MERARHLEAPSFSPFHEVTDPLFSISTLSTSPCWGLICSKQILREGGKHLTFGPQLWTLDFWVPSHLLGRLRFYGILRIEFEVKQTGWKPEWVMSVLEKEKQLSYGLSHDRTIVTFPAHFILLPLLWVTHLWSSTFIFTFETPLHFAILIVFCWSLNTHWSL